jgi:hypothetical protein
MSTVEPDGWRRHTCGSRLGAQHRCQVRSTALYCALYTSTERRVLRPLEAVQVNDVVDGR